MYSIFSVVPSVVILSARVEPRDKIRGLQEGAVDYITKPFSVRGVLENIGVILGGPEENRETPAGR